MKPGTKVALLVIALFALMACAWTALFYAANQAHVESVPLQAPGRAGPPGPPSSAKDSPNGGPGGPALPETEEAR